jgi:hypothetical protein
MRLNRRKNRGSEDRPKRPSRRVSESSSEGSDRSEIPRDERRKSIGGAVRSVRSRNDSRAASKGKPRAGSPRRRRARADWSAQRKRAARVARSVAADGLGVAREILRWPARIWMAVAEALGSAILAIWRAAILPALRVARRLLAAGLAFGERTVTPARGLAVVALAATITLGASQFGDYRAVQVGTPQYVDVQDVAQAPEVDRAVPRSAHGVAVFAIAVACLFVTFFAVWRNWRLARLLLFLGLAVVGISLFIDRPEGLHLGTAGEAYAGAHAILLGIFWVQLFSGVTLAVAGPLLATQLRKERAGRRRPSRARRGRGEVGRKRTPRLRPGVGT